jgi:ribosomal subunit interface protein
MEILFRNAEGTLSSSDREYAVKKLGHLDRFLNKANKVEIVHLEHNRVHRVEVTVFADGHVVRGEEQDASVRAAIDLVSDKLYSRLHKVKEQASTHTKRKSA